MKIMIQQVIDAIEQANDGCTGFWDSQTGEIVWLWDENSFVEQNEELAELIENNTSRFYCLPTKFEIHEYSIMESFVEYLPNGRIKGELSDAIRGKGAFRRFKQSVCYHGIEQLWYDYRSEVYQEKAVRWCADNEIEYD